MIPHFWKDIPGWCDFADLYAAQVAAAPDPCVAQALRLIHERLAERIFVRHIVADVPLCRRALERRRRATT